MEYSEIVRRQKEYFAGNATKTLEHRLETLRLLEGLLKKNEAHFLEALEADLGKSADEAFMTEIGIVYEEIRFMKRHLKKWMKAKSVKTAMTHLASKAWTIHEPYGAVLVISPWNYPYQLALTPLIGAIASGNTVVLKPSELAPKTSDMLFQVLSKFREEIIAVVLGDALQTTKLLQEPFDYCFFTGSSRVGKLIMGQVAEQLMPVTLELGGKSPVIVSKDADLKLAAKRVAFGKWLNAGQTCIAPDYAFVDQQVYDQFKQELIIAIRELYGENPLENKNYGRIVNQAHFKRLRSYVDGIQMDEQTLKMAPFLLENPDPDSSVMQEEIFGPILPLYSYQNLEDVLRFIKERPKPLALYLFTKNRELERKVLFETSSGSVCVNDTLMQISTPYLPFGGVGASGMGSYHGYQSFETFSHQKSVLRQPNWLDFGFRYPSSKWRGKILRLIFK